MGALQLVGLPALMALSTGSRDLTIGLIDGPVAVDHPEFVGARIASASGEDISVSTIPGGTASMHGTFTAGVLVARRGSYAPAICPTCTVVSVPIFREDAARRGQIPTATPKELARGITDCIEAGALVINISAAIVGLPIRRGAALTEALDRASRRGAIVVAATSNEHGMASSELTRHPAVLPVVACDAMGRPLAHSSLSPSTGRSGLLAPGQAITSLAPGARWTELDGTSAAAPIVTGAIALMWSLVPAARGQDIKRALRAGHAGTHRALVPPLLNASAAYRSLRIACSQEVCT